MYDLLLQNARVSTAEAPVTIAVAAGRIAEVGAQAQAAAARRLDVEGRVVLPGFVEGHIHLDKALTRDEFPNHSGTFAEAIRRNRELTAGVTQENVYRRARETALWALRCGTTTLRTHVNVDPELGLKGIHALLELREHLRGLLDLQIVALGRLTGPDGRRQREIVAAALEEGADLVGGASVIEPDQRAFVEEAFRLATRYDRSLDLHVDESESPADFVLGELAERTIREGYEGRVVAGHCCSLAAVDDATAQRTIELVARAGISVVTLPATNLFIQGRGDRHPIRRGLTRVKELLAAGVNVICGSDNIKDMFNPFGQPDLLLMAHFLGHAAQLGALDEQEYLIECITTRPATALATSAEIAVGAPADLVVLDTQSRHDVISDLPARRWVIKGGRVVVSDGEVAV